MAVRYRSLVPGGFYSSDPFDRSVPVSIRCNNPGAINGASWEKTYPGYVDTVETTPGNKTTIFEAPEYGVAVWWELLRRYAKAGVTTVGEIINRYGGGQDYSTYVRFVTKQTGFTARKKVSLDDDAVLLAFGKAMFRYEAGRPTPLQDAQITFGLHLGRAKGLIAAAGPVTAAQPVENRTLPGAPTPLEAVAALADTALTLDTFDGVRAAQSKLIECGYLDPPADGGFGPVTQWALRAFAEHAHLPVSDTLTPEIARALASADPLPLVAGDDLAGKIVSAMQRNNYWIARHPDCVNIVYVEGLNPDGTPNDNRPNVFNDVRVALRVQADGVPTVVGIWDGTTEPSRRWTLHPMNKGGAFHIKFGQYKAWIKGWYHTHEALIQAGEIEGYRDPHKTFKRDLNYPVHGSNFGVHQHWGYDLPHDDMGNSSAGCLVGRTKDGHRRFMSVVLADARYTANAAYRFLTAVMPAGDLKQN
jgi:peptidoglycan hydrolase-like protein with peptidoglycan-binding domain